MKKQTAMQMITLLVLVLGCYSWTDVTAVPWFNIDLHYPVEAHRYNFYDTLYPGPIVLNLDWSPAAPIVVTIKTSLGNVLTFSSSTGQMTQLISRSQGSFDMKLTTTSKVPVVYNLDVGVKYSIYRLKYRGAISYAQKYQIYVLKSPPDHVCDTTYIDIPDNRYAGIIMFEPGYQFNDILTDIPSFTSPQPWRIPIHAPNTEYLVVFIEKQSVDSMVVLANQTYLFGCVAYCSVPYLQFSEACKDGPNNPGCLACVPVDGYTCGQDANLNSICAAGSCGNGILEYPEQCDTGADYTACNQICEIQDYYQCTGDIGSPSVCTPICGDKIVVDGLEVCDTGLVTGCLKCTDYDVGFFYDPQYSIILAQCGDGVKAYTEECDNGLLEGCDLNCFKNPGYHCTEDEYGSSNCVTQCGDGIISGNEACQTMTIDSNGNLAPVKGCTSDCTSFDSHYSCHYTTPITYSNQFNDYLVRMGTSQYLVNDSDLNALPSYYTSKTVACTPICGDGFHASGQACDNKNLTGCINCTVDKGYSCADNSNQLSVCTTICGDGYRTGAQACDNKQQAGCTTCATIDRGYTCTEDADKLSTCITTCGDGIKAGTEQCDNGNLAGCTANCQWSPGYDCSQTSATGASICVETVVPAVCGNQKKESGQQCDNGNQAGCSANCKVDKGYYCTENAALLSSCTTNCGDSIKAGTEDCDNGNQAGCSANCKVDTGYSCIVNTLSQSICGPICGDGLKISPQQCDNRNQAGCLNCNIDLGYYCTENTALLSICSTNCGDSIKAGTEQCDNGNQLGCSTGCVFNKGYSCTVNSAGKSICGPVCGDGLKISPQECDNGNLTGCLNCKIDQGFYCKNHYMQTDGTIDQSNTDSISSSGLRTQPTSPYVRSVCYSTCGDGIKASTEQCDNRNRVGCVFCKEEKGYNCTENAQGLSTCAPICGDSIHVYPEQCDNGKNAGCEDCRVTLGFFCYDDFFLKSTCISFCGDRIRASNEDCDNGGKKGCSSCVVEAGYTCTGNLGQASSCKKNK